MHGTAAWTGSWKVSACVVVSTDVGGTTRAVVAVEIAAAAVARVIDFARAAGGALPCATCWAASGEIAALHLHQGVARGALVTTGLKRLVCTLVVDACVDGAWGAVIAVTVFKTADFDVGEVACVADTDVLGTGFAVVAIGVIAITAIGVVDILALALTDVAGADEAGVCLERWTVGVLVTACRLLVVFTQIEHRVACHGLAAVRRGRAVCGGYAEVLRGRVRADVVFADVFRRGRAIITVELAVTARLASRQYHGLRGQALPSESVAYIDGACVSVIAMLGPSAAVGEDVGAVATDPSNAAVEVAGVVVNTVSVG